MAGKQTGRPVVVDLANGSEHVKGGMGINSQKYKGVLTSSPAAGGVARPRPLCGLCWGSTLDDAPDVSCPTSLAYRPHARRGLTKHHLLLGHNCICCSRVGVCNINGKKSHSAYIGDNILLLRSAGTVNNISKLGFLFHGLEPVMLAQ